ncbi:hypothetical protein CGCF415_v010824 [Colletotrichum fructicola]|uniref:Uncharacterized protein n=1 Tax=Colletotrichum fructicola (strain Nara gc5) TaxID=1213859 RepID=A0A7J6JP88_COLFN|nr:uncharacterized protein CGMCC3_g15980 [Colletotrichum fructicola]KAF4492210.1 hypothetical protein CGGC5_v001608 [Colletotrichum fructicola Nara gc5]KAE9567885.1 hypothetical protein CGMCC3_g15980 [Colletotrichum fructicola]KAF4413103.1 hypothetical protein CFRS1_v004353 [Colletotrichum fructicola]KAF4898359.1 hypothetical protein CGCF415_v010824 [Colletotrichum fructicola]KAF4904352.1 hypothetical protein CGCFRS4_v001194 [Colletotrichum fructicola]
MVRKQLNAIADPSSGPRAHNRDAILAIDRDGLSLSMTKARNGTTWTKYRTNQAMNEFLSGVFDASRGPSLRLCPSCVPKLTPSYIIPDSLYMRIFADTITETGSPARALQALYFTLERSIYYNRMSSYSLNEPDREAAVADIVTFEPMQVPKDFKGYWAVAGILAVFLAAFAAVIWLYRPTQYSLPGNSWHVIAQVSESAELVEVLQKARLATDDEVDKLIEGISYPPSSPVSGGATSYVKKVLDEARRHFLAGRESFVASGSKRAMPRFVLQKGVFVGVPEEEMNTTLRASGFQRRTVRKGSESENAD